jgi:hypothetical protein
MKFLVIFKYYYSIISSNLFIILAYSSYVIFFIILYFLVNKASALNLICVFKRKLLPILSHVNLIRFCPMDGKHGFITEFFFKCVYLKSKIFTYLDFIHCLIKEIKTLLLIPIKIIFFSFKFSNVITGF